MLEAVITGTITPLGHKEVLVGLREQVTRMADGGVSDPPGAKSAIPQIARELGYPA